MTRRALIGWSILLAALSAQLLAITRLSGWQQVGPAYRVDSVAVARTDPNVVYIAATDTTTGQSGAFRSTDSGSTWELVANSLPGDTATTIAVDPRDASRLFATTVRDTDAGSQSTRLYISADAGVSWSLGGDFASACGGEFAFADPGLVYVALGCSGQLLASPDSGQTWQSREIRLDLLRSGPYGELYGLEQESGEIVRSVDGGLHWAHESPPACSLFTPAVYGMAVDSLGRLFVSTGHFRMIFDDCPGMFRSDDGGHSWRQIHDSDSFASILADESDPSAIYATAFSPGYEDVRVSRDGGYNWTSLNLPAAPLALSPSERFLYACTPQGLYRLLLRWPRVVAPR